jgi:cytochrome P450
MDLDFTLRPDEGLPFSAHRRLREAGPVVWGETLGGWLVSSYDGVRTVLSDVAQFTSAGTPVAETLGAEGMLVNDTPFHHSIRAVWAKQVSVAAMTARMHELEAYADEVLEAARPRLEAGESVDFIPLFRDFVMHFIAGSFAVPRDRMGAFVRWTELSADTPAVAMEEGSEAQQRHFTAKRDVFDLVYEQMDDRAAGFARGEEPQDFIALMVAAMEGNGITRSVAADNLFNFILGAFDTTEKWLANIMVTLYSSPELLAELHADRRLIVPFNEEVMRFDCVAQTIQRRVRQDGVTLEGQRMKAGDPVFVLLGAANRDPAKFTDADRFDMHRPPLPHLGFGVGFHHCLGLHIVRLEAQVFISVLIDTFPKLRVAAADYGDSWALWGPRALYMERDAA